MNQPPVLHDLPHAPGYTLAAEAFMEPDQLVGFSIAHQPLSVFMHFHNFYELALVVEGTGLHMTGSGEQRVHRGSVVFVTPGVSHGWRMGEGLVVYNCMLRVEAAEFDLPWARRDEWLGHLFGPPGVDLRRPVLLTIDEVALEDCLRHLDAIRERPADERSEAYDLGHLLLALDVLARYFDREQPERLSVDPRASEVVAAAIDLLDHDLQRRWTLDELAGQLYVGTFHLVRQFNRWVGLPPIAYLNRRRAERAAMLLATTETPIRSIGAEVGWPDPSQFSRRFRQHMEMSPRAYRTRSRRHFAARRRQRADDLQAADQAG
jgi:AraC-like DNA-binding protein/mannose-6-phosphate isomerase-like protein (cupin superfamily)